MKKKETEFKEGQKFQSIYIGGEQISLGCGTAYKITVVMEKGQYCDLPWFAVYDYHGKLISKWNGAFVEGVVYEQTQEVIK
jgi:hypothetical protein